MPSLRQKVTTYFRQLSFIAEPRDGHKSKSENDDNFIVKYLEGRMERIYVPGPEIKSAHNPTEMPDLRIGPYMHNTNNIIAACTGPDEGLTGIKRSKLHLSASFADDIDFIDTITDADCLDIRSSATTTTTKSSSTLLTATKPTITTTSTTTTTTTTTPTSRYQSSNNKFGKINNIQYTTTTNSGIRSRKNSKTNIAYLNQSNNNHIKDASSPTTIVVSMVSTKFNKDDQNNKNLLNTKTDVKLTKDLNSKQNSTERLLHEAVTNQSPRILSSGTDLDDSNIIAGVSDWKMAADYAYGISVSLYEINQLTKEPTGSPIADCYGMLVKGNAALLALADGVNWGDGARLAARSAVHGCLDYLDRAIFGLTSEVTTTQEVFVSLLRGLWEGHGCILEVGGALSTLTVAVVLPLANNNDNDNNVEQQYVVCACNVGDSLAYVYSKKHGVRELTLASHDIANMRDMRDALGAIGPADGNKPELSNLTFSMTTIERGDIVFLTSDGISDNFDPVVGKFAEAWTADVKMMPSHKQNSANSNVLAPKRQNKSASAIYSRLNAPQSVNPTVPMPRTKKSPINMLPPSTHSRPKYMRSHTVIEPTRPSTASLVRPPLSPTTDMSYIAKIPKSMAGLPLVTGPQRHALTIYRLEDLLSYGINGKFSPCLSARRLCHLLIDFVRMITSARRKTLEQHELFYKLSTGADGIRREVEFNRMQHRAARKRVIDSSAFAALPGKLDHASVVAYTVGNYKTTTTNEIYEQNVTSVLLQSKEFQETNF